MKHFITSVNIKKVRHLENIDIPLGDTPKHLILTGKNGSGKTSVLEEINNCLEKLRNFQINTASRATELLRSPPQNCKFNSEKITLTSSFTTMNEIVSLIKMHSFIIAYFDAKRQTEMNKSKGPRTINPASFPHENASRLFIEYLVHLKAQKAFSSEKNNSTFIEKVDKWFKNFEGFLCKIFNDEHLKLEFDSVNYEFYIKTKDREKFTLNELSSGYSAIIRIITELMLQMEKGASNSYDVEGIVLIDEIDVHLHVELQKSILPFLTTFFPNIQFIVTTHSPFVLSSISNAVIYDLENRTLIEDLSAYSYTGIVESYFDSDQYSTIIKDKMTRYEDLKKRQSTLSKNEHEEMIELERYLELIDYKLDPELVARVTHLKVQYGALTNV